MLCTDSLILRAGQAHRIRVLLVTSGWLLLCMGSVGAGPVLGGFGAPRSPDGFLEDSTGALVRFLLQVYYPDIEFLATQQLTDSFFSQIDAALLSPSTSLGSIPVGLSPDEQATLYDYALHGGGLLIAGEGGWGDNGVQQSIFTPFGMQITGRTGGHVTATAVNPMDSPILNGPYGLVTSSVALNTGWFTDLGPFAQPLLKLPNGFTVMAEIPPGALGPGSGPVVLTADGQVIYNNPLLAANVASLLLPVPEPSSWLLLAAGTAMIAGFRRNHRMSSGAELTCAASVRDAESRHVPAG